MTATHGDPLAAPHPPAPPPPAAAAESGQQAAIGGRPGRQLVRRIALIGAAVLLATATATLLTAIGGGDAVRPDPPARAFTLTRLGATGDQISLAAYAGRPVIVNFFASWCVPCKREIPMLARFYRSHRGTVVILGIDANDRAAAALRFLRQAGVSYPVGFDQSATVTTSYGVLALPQTFFLNARHRIVRHVFGGVPLRDLQTWAAGVRGARRTL